MTRMSAVPPMHEEMQERAGKDQQIRKNPERMRPVFREKEEGGDQEEADGDEPYL
jgi:hypothetical protein